jgi:hypothetical protein
MLFVCQRGFWSDAGARRSRDTFTAVCEPGMARPIVAEIVRGPLLEGGRADSTSGAA